MILSINLPTIIVLIILIIAICCSIYFYNKGNKNGCSCCNQSCSSCNKNQINKEFELVSLDNKKHLIKFKKLLNDNKVIFNFKKDSVEEVFNSNNQIIIIKSQNKNIGIYVLNKLDNLNVDLKYIVLLKNKCCLNSILKEVLLYCKRNRLNKILIQCYNNDLYSGQAILLNNGVCEEDEKNQNEELYLKRFWIDFNRL